MNRKSIFNKLFDILINKFLKYVPEAFLGIV
jgi:hypothetical protein